MGESTKSSSPQVGVRELRQNLSVYLDRVKEGERLEVTEHGRPVALLVPLPDDDDQLERMIAEGRAIAPTRLAEVLRTHPPLPAIPPSRSARSCRRCVTRRRSEAVADLL
jgi:prevent-host-death family protein